MLNLVINNAKRYFANPDVYDRAWKDEISDEEDLPITHRLQYRIIAGSN